MAEDHSFSVHFRLAHDCDNTRTQSSHNLNFPAPSGLLAKRSRSLTSLDQLSKRPKLNVSVSSCRPSTPPAVTSATLVTETRSQESQLTEDSRYDDPTVDDNVDLQSSFLKSLRLLEAELFGVVNIIYELKGQQPLELLGKAVDHGEESLKLVAALERTVEAMFPLPPRTTHQRLATKVNELTSLVERLERLVT